MSVIEDTRKLLQDFPAPELKELSSRVDSLERRIEERFNSSERLAAERHNQVMEAISRLADFYDLRERVTRIEARETALASRPTASTSEAPEVRERAS
jgi:tellurite resistance protein